MRSETQPRDSEGQPGGFQGPAKGFQGPAKRVCGQARSQGQAKFAFLLIVKCFLPMKKIVKTWIFPFVIFFCQNLVFLRIFVTVFSHHYFLGLQYSSNLITVRL